MCCNYRIHFFLVFCFLIPWQVLSTHFRGASITWKPLDPANYDGTIIISHRIAWRNSYDSRTRCTQSTIENGNLIGIGDYLYCRNGCSGRIGSMRYYCTDFSSSEDWSAGTRSYQYNMREVMDFEASYTGGDWISLVEGGGNWEVRVKGNLTARPDTGVVNSSPISSMSPIVRLLRGCNHTIVIPVGDVDGDEVRCRWSRSDLRECAGVCQTFSGAVLNERECTLQYEAIGTVGWYAVALQIEDFMTATDTTPLSSVPVQFLVQVFESSNSTCTVTPTFVGSTRRDGSCIGVPINTTFHEPFIAQSFGNVSINDIITVSPAGLLKSTLTQYDGMRSWYVNVTWSPSSEQTGPNIFCFTAEDSNGLTSAQSCITLLGGVEAPDIVNGSQVPMGEVYSSHREWSIQFNKQFFRSTRSRYIKIIEKETNRQVVSIDVAISPNVTFPDSNLGRTLYFYTNYTFTEKKLYYVLLDPGVVVGEEFCGAESPAIHDKDYWVVSIADTTPPSVTFINRPSYSNENVTITWEYNEEVTSTCTIQYPSNVFDTFACNETFNGTSLDDGLHTLYIQFTDLAGNSAPEATRHTWTVDVQPPVVRLTSYPPAVSNKGQFTFSFNCLNEWQCSFMCSIHTVGQIPQYSSCNGSYTTQTLINGGHYEFAVKATDGVGNVGEKEDFQWMIDTTPPVLSSIANVNIICGEDYSTNTTGSPVATDNIDPMVSVSYRDVPAAGCRIHRIWSAIDDAENVAMVTQIISFINPRSLNVVASTAADIPCGSVGEILNAAYELHNDFVVSHPCDRPVNISYTDSSEVNRCGFSFVRTWTLADDCGMTSSFQQTIRVLEPQYPDRPMNGETNVGIYQRLSWPQYTGAFSYKVFVWRFGSPRPHNNTAEVTNRYYRPLEPYPPGTRLLWQIMYSLSVTTSVPSPIWGFETRSFVDLVVSSLSIPSYAYSGDEFELSWTVINSGNITTRRPNWYDAIFISRNTDGSGRRQMGLIRQSRYLDPQDGYTSTTSVMLNEDDLGNFFVFVATDHYSSVEEIDRDNNVKVSAFALEVKLTPPPNLVVMSTTFIQSTYSGEQLAVTWTVSNEGTGITASNTWHDVVFLSMDMILDKEDTLLTTELVQGYLTAGNSYTKSAVVEIPNAIYGTYYIIIVTDADDDVYEYLSEDDNTRTSESSLEILLSPPPDLIVSSVVVNDTYVTGNMMKVRYQISNQGSGEPFERFWQDQVVLTSSVSTRSVVLSTKAFTGSIAPFQSYTREVEYFISPNMQAGLYNLSVHTDYNNKVFEFTNENNNVKWQSVEIEEKLSDLQVVPEDVTVTTLTTVEGNSFLVNYSVVNHGEGSAIGAPWTDKIAVSKTSHFSRQSSRLLANFVQTIRHIDSGSGYTAVNLIVDIPSALFDNVYIHILVDYDGKVKEEQETNNEYSEGPILLSPVFANLTIVYFANDKNGSNVFSGDMITLTWNVLNTGNGQIKSMRLVDGIYLSSTPVRSDTSTKLGQAAYSRNLLPDEQYQQSLAVTIPEGLFGGYYLILVTDIFNRLVNSTAASAVYVKLSIPPTPDFEVTFLTYTTTQNKLSLSWTVTNNGNSMRREGTWIDAVFLSEDMSFNASSAIYIGQSTIRAQLKTLQQYSTSRSLLLPSMLNGEFFILVQCDTFNTVLEVSGEDNNFGVSNTALVIESPPMPHLQVEVISELPTGALKAGQDLTIQYEITNKGDGKLSMTSWTDGIYLYPTTNANKETVLADGIFLKEILHNRQLEIGEKLVISADAVVPFDINQTLFLYVLVDVNRRLEVNSNTAAVASLTYTAQAIVIEPGELPDLIGVPPVQDLTLQSGRPYNVTFTVINIGNGTINRLWYDAIILSFDPYLDPFDIKLKSELRRSGLAYNETYSQSAELFLPYDLSYPEYYLIYHVDVQNHIREGNEENNIVSKLITIQSLASTDLSVSGVSFVPPRVEYGEVMQADWLIRNNGSLHANGYKCDTVYLSDDRNWDIEDHQLGTPQCSHFSISPYNSTMVDSMYDYSVRVPFVSQQQYHVVVRSRSNIRDVNLENNLQFSSSFISIEAEPLQLNTLTTVNITTGQDRVFRIDNIPAKEALIATLNSDYNTTIHRLLLRYRTPPTGFDFDASSLVPLASNQRVTVQNTKSGSYYLKVESSGLEVDNYEIELLVKIASFEILDIGPRRAAPLGSVTLYIQGTLFAYSLEASLVDSNNLTRSIASNVYWYSSEKVFATFNVTNISIGYYSVQLLDVREGLVAILNSSLQIISGIPGKLSISTESPRPLRSGENGTATVHIRNVGYTDIPTPLLVLQSSERLSFSLMVSGFEEKPSSYFAFFSIPDEGPGGIIPPQSVNQLLFKVFTTEGFIGREILQLSQIEATNEFHDFVYNKGSLRPSVVPDDVWDLIWENFLDSCGTSWESFQSRMNEVSNTLSLRDDKVYSLSQLVNYQLKIADGLLSGDTILDAADLYEESYDGPLFFIFQRSYSPHVSKRRTSGPLGQGWTLPWWEMRIVVVSFSKINLIQEREEIPFVLVQDEPVRIYGNPQHGEIIVQHNGYEYEPPGSEYKYHLKSSTGHLENITTLFDNDAIITVEYNNTHLPQYFRRTDGDQLNVVYDENNLISSVSLVDQYGNVKYSSYYTYDASAHYLIQVTVDGDSVQYDYNEDGDLIRVLYATGEQTSFRYNANSFLSSVETYTEREDLLSSMEFLYNWNGRVQMTIMPENKTTNAFFDTSGEILHVTTNDSTPFTQFNEPEHGRKLIRSGSQVISVLSYDPQSNSLSSEDANGDVTVFTFGEDFAVRAFEDSGGNVYGFEEDNEQRITRLDFPDSSSIQLSYVGNGSQLLSEVVRRSGAHVEYIYDFNDNLVWKSINGDEHSTSTFDYSDEQQIVSATNNVGSVLIGYNSQGLPESITYPNGHTLYYGFNGRNQRIYLADNHGFNVTYHYDEKNRLAAVRNATTGEAIAEWDYVNHRQPVKKTLGNGGYTTYKYDSTSERLLEIRNYLPNGTLLSYFVYKYDRNGHLERMTSMQGNWSYIYDAFSQLTGWTDPSGDSTEITYDSRKNRITMTMGNVSSGYSVNNLNQYTAFGDNQTFQYDKDGNLLKKIELNGAETFRFSAEGRLTATETANKSCSYIYTALGSLYKKNCTDSTSVTYIVDPFGVFGNDIVAEISGDETTYHVHTSEEGLVASLSTVDRDRSYYYFDRDGSVINIVNEAGDILNEYSYDPFGRKLHQYENESSIFQYVGRYGIVRVEELEHMYSMRARLYDAEHGRFTSPDPLEIFGNSVNFYAYVNNNPIELKDPQGLILPLIISAASGAVKSVGVYVVNSYVSGEEITWGGAAGSAASGVVGGPLGNLKTIPKGLKTIVDFVSGVGGGTAGDYIQKSIDGKPFDYKKSLMDQTKGYIQSLAGITKPFRKWIPKNKKNARNIVIEHTLDIAAGSVDSIASGYGGKFIDNITADIIESLDPNDILGPAGYGDAHFIPSDTLLEYKIRFENHPNATAPAQRVLITYQLDEDLDIRTFRVGSFGFGDTTQEIFQDRAVLQVTVDVLETHGVIVHVRAGIDIVKGEAVWELQSIDPSTGGAPIDPTVGFLPPNNGTSGQGFVVFSIRPKISAPNNARIDAQASIIFDENEPIETPPIFNTIDNQPPGVNISVQDGSLSSSDVTIELNKTDGESGVREVNLYEITGTGDIKPLTLGLTADVAILSLLPGNVYRVFATAVDNVGNQQPLEQALDNFILLILPSIQCPQNCSMRGQCTSVGICKCDFGYYGNDCSREEPPVEPPVLQTFSRGGEENQPIIVYISAEEVEQNTTTLIYVENFPQNTTFSKGVMAGTRWVFYPQEFGEVEMVLPDGYTGNVTLKMHAVTTKGGENASRVGILVFTVLPVVSAPGIRLKDAMGICYDRSNGSNMIGIDFEISTYEDLDNVKIEISGIPEGYNLTNGNKTGNNSYLLTRQNLNGLSIEVFGNFVPFDFLVTAINTEEESGIAAYATLNVEVKECEEVEDTPTEVASVTPPPQPIIVFVILGVVLGIACVLLVAICCCCCCCCCYGYHVTRGKRESYSPDIGLQVINKHAY